MTTHRMTWIALVATLSFVTRIMFSFLPNVQPTTVIFLLVTIFIGVKEGIIVATLSMILSNIYLGFGIWTIPQIASYALILMLVSLITKPEERTELPVFLVIAFLSGLAYGFLISIMNIPLFGVGYFFVYYLNGFTFDVAHAVGNVTFTLVLYPTLVPLFEKQKYKLDCKELKK